MVMMTTKSQIDIINMLHNLCRSVEERNPYWEISETDLWKTNPTKINPYLQISGTLLRLFYWKTHPSKNHEYSVF